MANLASVWGAPGICIASLVSQPPLLYFASVRREERLAKPCSQAYFQFFNILCALKRPIQWSLGERLYCIYIHVGHTQYGDSKDQQDYIVIHQKIAHLDSKWRQIASSQLPCVKCKLIFNNLSIKGIIIESNRNSSKWQTTTLLHHAAIKRELQYNEHVHYIVCV